VKHDFRQYLPKPEYHYHRGGSGCRWDSGLSVVAVVLLLIGCGIPDSGVSPVKPDSPIVVKDTIWSEIAKRIDSGRIADTDALILVVDDLRDADEISDAERSRFFEAFPSIKQKRRDCTPDDSKTLRALK